ncbi:MAG: hypothetical protein Q7J05_01135 [Paludibacter sp.]|nr:hypothetical protein [Paludibacter sp.]
MKKIFYFLSIMLFTISSCTQEDIPTNNDNKVLSKKDLEMRYALELSSNILVNMIANNPNYYDKLNKHIIDGSPNCLEDRVLMRDLFAPETKADAAYMKSNSDFSLDFKNAFARNQPQKMNAVGNGTINLFSNPDSLIQYLTDNHVSLYCPIPLEYFEKNNRIPAISFHPIDNDSINSGYILNETGEITEVKVSQAYNNLHPVWILMPYEEIIPNSTKQNANMTKNTLGYEISVMRVYVKEYYGGIFDGDLNLHIIRAHPSSVTYNPTTNTYTGGIVTDISFKLPRSYVWNAKNGWWSGWYVVNSVWNTNWDVSETSHIMYIYEWDKKGSQKKTIPLNTYNANGQVNGTLGTLEYTSQSQDETIGLQQWSRNWFFDIINNGNPTWHWVHSSGNIYSEIDGDNIIRINPEFFMTMRVREY